MLYHFEKRDCDTLLQPVKVYFELSDFVITEFAAFDRLRSSPTAFLYTILSDGLLKTSALVIRLLCCLQPTS